MNRGIVLCLFLACSAWHPTPANAAELSLIFELPRLQVTEYRRPYLAVWLERPDQTVATTLAVWYEIGNGKTGTKWLTDLRQWWRRTGRDQQFPIDGVTGATRPAGEYRLIFQGAEAPMKDLATGRYTLALEAAREDGGREVVRIPFDWPAKSAAQLTARGNTELGAVALVLSP